MNFVHEDFLLQSKTARRLFHEYAVREPVLDFHSHLPAIEIAEDRRFHNITEIWLDGDHYKWRLMRANGIDERLCTGEADPYEKFLAWSKTVPRALRNPIYHWTHLELKRYFDIDCLVDEKSAKAVWEQSKEQLSNPDLSARGILKKFDVRAVCTTDDPCDDLDAHARINSTEPTFRVYPTFRPDKALQVDKPEQFKKWVHSLERASNTQISSLANFLDGLKRRHDAFHAAGGRLSDHGLPYCYPSPCSEQKAISIFNNALLGHAAGPEDHAQFAGFLMLFLARLDAEKGWTKQLHLGALRSVSSTKLRTRGPDTGFDCIGDWPQAQALCAYLDLLERENALPKMILYNLNAVDNYTFATAAGSFQDSSAAGKIQFGSAWWFLDQKDGIEAQLNTLSNVGSLSRFVGMVTDSRSFMSFPRHEYFRRVLCNLLGRDMESGELPNDLELVGSTVRNICFENARQFLGLNVSATPASSKHVYESCPESKT